MNPVSLRRLLAGVECRVIGNDDLAVSGITADSRKVRPGDLFVAIAGQESDGHDFIPAALAAGACAVVVEEGRSDQPASDVTLVVVEESRRAYGRVAANFFGNPADEMIMVAITGTNGKTTCSYLLEEMIRKGGGNPGVIGTINYRYNDVVRDATHTTPDALLLQQLLAEMAAAGVSHVVMEVSSHSLSQERVAGIDFDVALFTNLSRDHLDYHHDMESYFQAKARLFTHHLRGRAVLVDDGSKWLSRLVDLAGQQAAVPLLCGGGRADIDGEITAMDLDGMELALRLPGGARQLHSPLVGEFNRHNILAALGVGHALGLDEADMLAALSTATGAPGRLERLRLPEDVAGPAIFIDYAHTPAALENVLRTLGPLCRGRLIVLFGCGGDRDQGKRRIMGRLAAELADYLVITSDNPRSEEPLKIMAEIEGGIRGVRQEGYVLIESRRTAIAHALAMAEEGDLVLLAGKGHETYQLTREGRSDFDDRFEAHKFVLDLGGQGRSRVACEACSIL